MDRGSLACGVSPRQGLRPHSLNTSSVNRRLVSRYFDILIFCRRALAAFGISFITTTKVQSLAQQVQRVNQQSRQQAGKQQSFLVKSHPLPLPERKPKAIPGTRYSEKQKNSSCKNATPPHRLPPEYVKTPKTLNIRSPP